MRMHDVASKQRLLLFTIKDQRFSGLILDARECQVMYTSLMDDGHAFHVMRYCLAAQAECLTQCGARR
jgi:hypothetical protein